MNTSRSPALSAPACTRRTPYQKTAAVPAASSSSMARAMAASSRVVRSPARRLRRLPRRNSLSRNRSPPNAWISRTPCRVSLTAEAIRPSCLRWRCAASRMRPEKRKVVAASGGSSATTTSASRQSIASRMASMVPSSRTAVTPWTSASTIMSRSTLMSPVSRISRSPLRRRWWKPSDSRCRWAWARSRRPKTSPWPARAVRKTWP